MSQDKLYNTGFIPKDSYKIRLQQRLEPQDISSSCIAPFAKAHVEMFLHRNDGDTCAQNSRANFPTTTFNYKNQTNARPNLYPIKMVGPDYGGSTIPNNAACLQFMHAI